MVRRNGAEVKRERMHEIARFIQRSLVDHSEVSLSRVLALLEYEFGLTKPKLLEYLEVLQNIGQFTIDNVNDKIMKSKETE